MKTTKKLIIAIMALVLTLSLYVVQSAEKSNVAVTAADPNPDSIGIFLADRDWSLRELQQTALAYLDEHGKTNRSITQTSVYIYAGDRARLCLFTFSQGFGELAWRVTIDREGRPGGLEENVRRDAFGPGAVLKTNVPPQSSQ